MKRRTALKGIALLTGLAGCIGGSDGGGDGTTAATATATTTPTTTPTETTTEETITVDTTTAKLTESIESAPLPDRGDDRYIEQVRTFPSEGRKHVEGGSDVDYGTMPPTSGPHYSGVVEPGMYKGLPPLGRIVHNLEHGAVVIYYDPERITDAAKQSLQAFAGEHTDPFAHVVVVPSPLENPSKPYVLTAWRKMLRLDEYDPKAVRAFLAEYLGRGPEHKVR